MANGLLALIQNELIPALGRPVRIVDEQDASSTGDALVILQVESLRIVVVRDRSHIRVEIGAMAHPEFSPSAQMIGDFLGLNSDDVSFEAPDTAAELSLVATFLNRYWSDLIVMFSAERFTATRQSINDQQKEWVWRRFGPPIEEG
jgi:hypothetical protein